MKIELSSNLSKQEQLIFDFVGKKEVDAGTIYSSLKDDFAERTLRKAISSLEEKKLIETRKEIKGRGFTRLIKKVAN